VACELAQKFGFVSRRIVWKHLTFEGRASKFKYWLFLKKASELAPYKSGVVFNHHLVLSSEYRKLLGEGTAVSNRSSIYFEHDEYLMDILLSIRSAGVIAEYWTEQELKMDRVLAMQTMGGVPDAKIPDLIFDLTTDRGAIRVAIEIERTRKSQRRYRLVQWGYSRLRRIDLLLFGVVDSGTEAAIRQEFDTATFSSDKRSIGYFTLNEFAKSGLASELRIRGKRPQLQDFLKRVCGDAWKEPSASRRQIGDKLEISVSSENEKTLESN
jgi:hypothetical protein